MADAFVHIGIPKVPGGVVIIPLVSDEDTMRKAIVSALRTAGIVQEKFLGTFPDSDPPPSNAEHTSREAPARSAPKCRIHKSAMKESRGGGWYCPRKVGDGYCEEKVDA